MSCLSLYLGTVMKVWYVLFIIIFRNRYEGVVCLVYRLYLGTVYEGVVFLVYHYIFELL